MRILAINSSAHMNGPREAGSIRRVIEARGDRLDWCVRGTDPLPATPHGYDGLIVFGGEMSVYDPVYESYFTRLCELVRAFDAAHLPILGSCLGSQVLAQAFGGEVHPGPVEYGFVPLAKTPEGQADPLLADIPPELHLFEMHGDTFTLPPEAVLLMRGDQVPHQVFRIGKTAYGFQCHFEVTPEIIEHWSSRHEEAGDRFSTLVPETIEIVRRDIDLHQARQEAFAEEVVARWLSLAMR